MDKAQALQQFWNSFGWQAYEQTTVPDNAPAQYITYESADGYIDNVIPLAASLWMRSTSWAEIERKAQEIGAYIGLGGKVIPYDDGKAWIVRASTFAQRMAEPADFDVRRILLNINVEFISA
jgi:hypothetical protein